jgi:large subunit ribosomal protein L9
MVQSFRLRRCTLRRLSKSALKGLDAMKVLLIKDVYKLGRAGDVKRVADGYGRNFLMPQGLAVLATPGALKQVESIRSKANVRRSEVNKEMGGLAGRVSGVTLYFASKAGETGKLYGSVTNQMIAESLSQKIGTKIDRRQVEVEPIRTLGEHKAHVRLTVDLTPEVKVIVYREGETPAGALNTPVAAAAPAVETKVAETSTEGQAS